jgi:hypothetical protein
MKTQIFITDGCGSLIGIEDAQLLIIDYDEEVLEKKYDDDIEEYLDDADNVDNIHYCDLAPHIIDEDTIEVVRELK